MRAPILLFSCLFTMVGWGQSNNAKYDFPEDYIQQPPMTFEFERYGNLPVNPYNGSVNIDIPLVSMPYKGGAVSFSASYSTKGVFINSIASEIGTDWALTGAGEISREIRGTTDFSPYGVPSNHKGWMHNDNDLIESIGYDSNGDPEVQLYNSSSTLDLNYVVRDFIYDTEPDAFRFNFNGISGSFFYDRDKNIVLNSEHILDITPPTTDEGEWVVKDDVGNTYYFGKATGNPATSWSKEWLSQYPNPQSRKNASSWKLRKIVTAYDETVDFSYTLVTTTQTNPYTNWVNSPNGYCSYTPPSFSNCVQHGSLGSTTTWNMFTQSVEQDKSLLSQVKYTLGGYTYTIDLIYSDRDNSSGGHSSLSGFKKLDTIKYRLVTSNDTTALREVIFNYLNNSDRLWLESIDFEDGNSNQQKSYAFEYNNEDQLPARDSYAMDLFGFYNGNTSNTGAIPAVYPSFVDGTYKAVASESYHGGWTPGTDDRSTDTTKIIYGAMSKITYPTGGYSTFEFQTHKFNTHLGLPNTYGAGIRIKTIRDYANSGATPSTRELMYSQGRVMSVPYYEFTNYKTDNSSLSGYKVFEGRHLSNRPLVQANRSAQGSHVGYGQVEVLFDSGNQGKEVHHFMNTGDGYVIVPGGNVYGTPSGGDIDQWYFSGIPAVPYDYSNGKPTLLETYAKEGSSYTLKSSKTYTYTTITLGDRKGTMVRCPLGTHDDIMMSVEDFTPFTNATHGAFYLTQWYTYNITSKKLLLTEVSEKTYSNSTHYVENKRETIFASDNTHIRETIDYHSTGPVSTEYYYVADLQGTTDADASFASFMISDHKTGLPIAAIQNNTTFMYSGTVWTYDNNGNKKAVYNYEHGPTMFTFDEDDLIPTGFVKRAEMDYDDHDLINYKLTYGATTSFLWSEYIFPEATVSNALYTDVYYNGFEGSTSEYTQDAYTGEQSRKVIAGSSVYSPELRLEEPDQGRAYEFSCWIKTESGYSTNSGQLLLQVLRYPGTPSEQILSVSGVTQYINDTQGEWQHYTISFDLSAAKSSLSIPSNEDVGIKALTVNNNGSHYYLLDECRLLPVDAHMQTFSFIPGTGVSNITDQREETTGFEYDEYHRLHFIKDADGNILSENKYNYR